MTFARDRQASCTWSGDTSRDIGPGARIWMAASGTGGPAVGVRVGAAVGGMKVAVAVGCRGRRGRLGRNRGQRQSTQPSDTPPSECSQRDTAWAHAVVPGRAHPARRQTAAARRPAILPRACQSGTFVTADVCAGDPQAIRPTRRWPRSRPAHMRLRLRSAARDGRSRNTCRSGT